MRQASKQGMHESMESCAKSIRPPEIGPAARRLYEASGAARFGLPEENWEFCLVDIAVAQLGPSMSTAAFIRFCGTLHLAELALGRSCALGLEPAWETLIATYSAAILAAAISITRPDETVGRELAQSLWTDLYCTPAKLGSYTGRGALENWLKATLYQANTNRFRSERRFVSLEESLCPVCLELAPRDLAEAETTLLVEQSMRAALREIAAEDRFLLASYYVDGRNLAQISAMLCVHESTVSRRIAKLLKRLQRGMCRRLRMRGITSDFALSLSLDFDLKRELS